MKKIIVILSSVSAFLFAPLVPATLLSYDIVVDGVGAWDGSIPRPFGLPPQPAPLTGKLTVDNTKTDKSGLIDFVFVTGAKAWTENFPDRTTPAPTSFKFDALGNLTEFLVNLNDAPGFLTLASNNTMNASDGTSSIFCNSCVHFSAAAAAKAPIPGTLALLVGACAAAGGLARRRRSTR